MLNRMRHHFLGVWSQWISHHPRIVIVLGVLLAVISTHLAVTQLTFQMDRNKLISDRLDWNKRFQQWQAAFPVKHDLLVVIDTQPDDAANQSRAETNHAKSNSTPQALTKAEEEAATAEREDRLYALLADLSSQLRQVRTIEKVVDGFDPISFDPATLRMADQATFDARLKEIEQAAALIRSTSLPEFLDLVNQEMAQGIGQADPWGEHDSDIALKQARQFGRFLAGMRTIWASRGQSVQPDFLQRVMMPQPPRKQLLRTHSGRYVIVRASPGGEGIDKNSPEQTVREVRDVIARLQLDHPQFDIGLTGIEVVESDETAAATWDATVTSTIAFVLIAVLLMIAFASTRTPILILVALLLAIAWTFGFLTLAIGHLQVISIVFTLILLGLGVAYGIHVASRFELVRHRYGDDANGFSNALRDTLEHIGPGLLTGALTTSAAFGTTLLTDFRGVAEMGLIAAVGVLLCLLSMVSVFPALLRIVKPGHRHVKQMENRRINLFNEQWFLIFSRRPVPTLVTAGLIVVVGVFFAAQMQFDFDLLKLQPAGVQSVHWQTKLVEDGESSVYYAVSLCDSMEQLRDRAEAFRSLSTVSDVGGMGMLIPRDEKQRLQRIEQLREHLGSNLGVTFGKQADKPASPPELETWNSKLGNLKFQLDWAAGFLRAVEGQQQIVKVLDRMVDDVDAIRQLQREMSPVENRAALYAANQQFLNWRNEVSDTLNKTLATRPLQPTDLPSALASLYTGQGKPFEGVYALEVYPSPPDGVGPLDASFLERFVSQVESVDKKITGVSPQVFRSGDLIASAYLMAGIYALLMVVVILVIDFQKVSDALLALVPVLIGFTITFALLEPLGMSINLANIIVLPLMFGIGVDAGVHVIHRFRQAPSARPAGLGDGTGKGISLTSLATIIGFACMMLAHHRGIQSLGFVLASGIGFTWIACLTVMPATLRLLYHFGSPQRRTSTLPTEASQG